MLKSSFDFAEPSSESFIQFWSSSSCIISNLVDILLDALLEIGI